MNTDKKEETFDHYETVAEELRMNGFDVRVIQANHGWLIEYDTVAKRMKYACTENTPMGDYYRFISILGLMLHKWGLEHKIEASQQNINHHEHR